MSASAEQRVSTWPLPALLRGARNAFAIAVRARLDAEGFDDLPPNGPYVLAAVAGAGAPLGEVIRQLGVSKQAGGQLVDTLVNRGYLDRSPDPDDRRRVVVNLTERGKAASATVRDAAGGLEAALEARVGPDALSAARLCLAVLTGLREEMNA